jgi:putative oxidoreductase
VTLPPCSEPPRTREPLRGVGVDFRPGVAAAIGGLFIYAGWLKVGDPAAFARDISNFHLVPWTVGVAMAFYLPWLEMICGAALFLGRVRAGAIAILTALTAVFIGASVIARMRGINVNCGCFGSASKDMSFGSHLALDVAILGALAVLWYWEKPRRRAA